jgi:hypothetical protein
MMRAILKGISSPDVELATYWPEDESCFGFLIEAQIGPENEKGTDLFQIMVCTPDWIKANYSKRKAVWGRHMLIVFEYDLAEIKSAINRYVERCMADDWHGLALKLSRMGDWEFEDYQSCARVAEPLSLAEVLDLLRVLDDASNKTTNFLETRKNQQDLCINGNREGLIRLARVILEVAQKGFLGAHQHLDEIGELDLCETPLTVCFKPAEWEPQGEQA